MFAAFPSYCLPCHESCSTCTGPNPNECIAASCATGYTYAAPTVGFPFSCTKTSCLEGCDKCIGGDANDCVDCSDKYAPSVTTYPTSCMACPFPCDTCTEASMIHCIDCQTGYYYDAGECKQCH